jgi:hypothetical protein
MFGLGYFVAAGISPSVGLLISVSCNILIVLFYTIDILYKNEFQVRINYFFFLMMLFLVSCIISLVRALVKGLPDETAFMISIKSTVLVVPFCSFVITRLYNLNEQERIPGLVFVGFSILLFLNLIGFYGLGLANEMHSIEGRLNFPFFDGFYNGACLIVIINLMIIYYLFRCWNDPMRFALLGAYFIINLVLLYLINSRICTLIFLFVAVLLCFKLLNNLKGLFVSSLFTVPLLLSSGLILYEVLTLPIFSSILQRVDINDVTTFNGRSFIWTNGMTWLLDDQRGIIFGNGNKGHYFLDLISDVARLWNPEFKDFHQMHMHSSSFELLISQGIVGFAVFMILFYQLLSYYRKEYQKQSEQGIFYAVGIFLLFIWQVDLFVYLESSGFFIFSMLLSGVVVPSKAPITIKPEKIHLNHNGASLNHS